MRAATASDVLPVELVSKHACRSVPTNPKRPQAALHGDRLTRGICKQTTRMTDCAGNHRPRILRSAQLLRSPAVNVPRNGLALTSFSRVVRPLASALASSAAASALSATESTATAPAGPAKSVRYSVPGVT